jgi:hypothetical protein
MATYVPRPDQHWFKSVGAADWPMDADWFDQKPNETEIIHYAKQPASVRVGDPLLYYAAVHQKIFGVVDVFTKPERDPQRERWPWFSQVRPKVIIKSLERAPSLDILAQINPEKNWHQFVRQMDYKTIDEDLFAYAAAMLIEAADLSKGDVLDTGFAAKYRRGD